MISCLTPRRRQSLPVTMIGLLLAGSVCAADPIPQPHGPQQPERTTAAGNAQGPAIERESGIVQTSCLRRNCGPCGAGSARVPGPGGAWIPGEGGMMVPGPGGAWIPGEGGMMVPGPGGAWIPGEGGMMVPGPGGAWIPGESGMMVPGPGGAWIPGEGGMMVPGPGGAWGPGGPGVSGMGPAAGPGAAGLGAAAEFAAGVGIAAAGSAALPLIQGDAGFACGVVTFTNNYGGRFQAQIGHPWFGCSRLNLAENGTPIPQDRFFAVYRHFEKVGKTDLLSSPGIDNTAELDVDRITFGVERTLWDGLMSFEARLPFAVQLDSDIDIAYATDAVTGAETTSNIPVAGTDFEIGNVALAWKMMLAEFGALRLSGGVGASLPTGHDVTIRADIDDDFGTLIPGQPFEGRIRSMIANETVFLTPFLGYAFHKPQSRFFTQGFLQFDVPMNKTRAVVGISGNVVLDPDTGFLGIAHETDLAWQTLMRLNTQFGYWLYRKPSASLLNGIAALLEVHWTSTLVDADLTEDFLIYEFAGQEARITIGNIANRVDIVNLTLGSAIEMGRAEITPGFTIPLSTGDQKPFDWEFTLLANYRY